MKHLFAIIGVAALLATITIRPAAAQSYSPASLGMTNFLYQATNTYFAAGTATALTNGPSTGVLKQQNVTFSSTLTAPAAGATNIYYFAPSVDQVYYDTNAASLFLMTNAVAGSTTGTAVKNFSVTGIGSLRLIQVVTTGTPTNVAHSFGTKIGCP